MKLKKSVKRLLFVIVVFTCMIAVRNIYSELNSMFNERNEMPVFKGEKTGLQYLSYLSTYDQKIANIMKQQDAYPQILLEMLSRNLDMTDYVLEYKENKGKVFSNNIGEVYKGNYPLLLQYDTRWGYGMYGDNVIAINGCGPTSVAMVIAGLTGQNNITPYDIAKFAYNHGYYHDGTSWSLFTEGVKQYGLIGKEVPLSKASMINELEQGHPIICSMGKGDFTTTGHIIVITNVKNGKFVINDSNSKERSEQLWDYERIEHQIKNLWSFQVG